MSKPGGNPAVMPKCWLSSVTAGMRRDGEIHNGADHVALSALVFTAGEVSWLRPRSARTLAPAITLRAVGAGRFEPLICKLTQNPGLYYFAKS